MTQSITGHTGLLCLLGSPVAHSISPAMHNEACDALGLDYAYLAFDVPEVGMPKAVEALKLFKARGWNITMPGKTSCARWRIISPRFGNYRRLQYHRQRRRCSDRLYDRRYRLYESRGRMRRKYYRKNMTPARCRRRGHGHSGSGCPDGVKEIDVFNIRDDFFGRLEEIAEKLNERTNCTVRVHDYSDPEVLRKAIANSAILVNGTSVGMAPNTDRSIIQDTSLFRPDLFVFDVIYNPKETKLLKDAKAAGCKTSNGMYMLLYQGAASFKLWTGHDMPVDLIKEKYFSA